MTLFSTPFQVLPALRCPCGVGSARLGNGLWLALTVLVAVTGLLLVALPLLARWRARVGQP